LRRAEAGDEPAHVLAADVDVDAGGDEPMRDRRDALAVGQPDDRPAPGVEGTVDDQVTFGEEQSRTRVVALVAAVGEPALIQPEKRQPFVSWAIRP
jgi:hypothetical protein